MDDACNQNLELFIGSDTNISSSVGPIFNSYAKSVSYMGKAGAGQHTIMCNYIMLSTQVLGTCEAILNGFKAGLKLDVMVDLLNKGFAGTISLKELGPLAL